MPRFSQAQSSVPPPKEDWQQVRETVEDMRSRARTLRTNALLTYNKAFAKCQRKFINSKCIDAAKKERIAAEHEATRIEKSALAIEKSVKTETREAKKVQRVEKARIREGLSHKPEVQARNKREKTELQIEKLRPPVRE